MAKRPAALLVLLALVLSACSGANAGEPVVIRVATATPTPIPTPEATPTPIEQPELVLSTTQVFQAGAVLVSVTGDVRSGSVRFLGRDHVLEQGARSMYTFAGVGVLDPPGSADLVVEFETHNGSLGVLQATIDVLPTEWEVDYLYFEPGEVEELLAPDVIARENQLLAQMYATYTPEKLWDGPWLIPTQGGITARFGSQRSINDGPPAGHHGGTDIGAPEGTPIIATSHGRVIMARELAVRGNMVIVDHGGGLLSGYAHMNDFAVAEGQEVLGGDLLGTVGNTGLSTGPHLHWEMSIHGILVDPWRFVDGTNGF
jgi:murein DD-endopeptidase MepM/ murein hydrolase activator NlpD